jgi:hypothetical protein
MGPTWGWPNVREERRGRGHAREFGQPNTRPCGASPPRPARPQTTRPVHHLGLPEAARIDHGSSAEDLEEIWSYVAEEVSPATADRLTEAIIDRFELLAEQPTGGSPPTGFREGVRSFTVENHVI